MGSWKYSNVGIAFNKNENDETLVKQVMECLGYEEADFLFLEGTGVNGPEWNSEYYNIALTYLDSNKHDNEYKDLFYILNVLFKNISVYHVNALGTTVSDYYSGEEVSFDPINNKIYKTYFNYCYGEGTAFDKRIKSGDLESRGTKNYVDKLEPIRCKYDLDSNLITSLIDKCTEKKYTKLIELIKKECLMNEAEIKRGVLIKPPTQVEEYIIPNNVKKIGSQAFEGCNTLKSVIIPNTVTKIESDAFMNCENLTSVNIPDSVIEIEESAFEGCKNLTSINIPNSVVEIRNSAFKGCKNLTNINIPNSVIKIEEFAFDSCKNLTSINIPDSVLEIGDYAFYGCENLTYIYIPDSVLKIGNSAFYDTPWYESQTKKFLVLGNNILYEYHGTDVNETVPDGIKIIGSHAFGGCRTIKSIIIPYGVKKINEEAFDFCENLENITLPESLEYIGRSAFCNCKKLKNITLPESLEYIDEYAFDCCKKLNNITIPNGVKKINIYTFSRCENLENITLPESLEYIDEYAFENCKNLKSITIPSSVVSIKGSAFKSCKNLKSITFTGNIKEISPRAFSGCKDIVINAPKGSSAIELAIKKGFDYIET